MSDKDIVTRLRQGDQYAKPADCRHDICNCAIMDDAANLIDSLHNTIADRDREIAGLREARDTWKQRYEDAFADAVRLNNEKCDAKWPDSNLLIVQQKAVARKQALEEAAQVADIEAGKLVVGELPNGVAVGLARMIRALSAQEPAKPQEDGK